MSQNRTDLITNYYHKVKSASKELTKKEHFKDLLHRLYHGEKEIEKIIDAISAGSEKTVLNIPRKDKIHRGSADTLYSNIIIEFENDLKKTGNHAKEQLAGYLIGEFKSGKGYNFILIASDCINWKVYAPDVSQLHKLKDLNEDELILNEIPSATFSLNENNAEDFYFWIDRFLFKEEKQHASLKSVEEAFGYQSIVFIESFREMTAHFQDVKKYGEVQVSYEQWKKFLSVAYGSFDASESNFLIHTYLSVFSKMLAYEVVSHDDYIDDDELKGILIGTIFDKYRIQNFVDNDFFHWVSNEKSFRSLKKVFRLIAQEISTFDFNNVDEDVLKGVYQELIDLDTRHALGEYYTPDWLCERIVNEFNFNPTDKILDPACGSGSFLRAAVHRLRKLNPDITVEQIAGNVYGIDIHPLSVQIAKTTLLLSLGKGISKAKHPIKLNIILANTLLSPDGVQNLFGNEFSLKIDSEEFLLNTQVLENVQVFDEALDLCEKLAVQTMNHKAENESAFENILNKQFPKSGFSENISEGFYKIYLGLKKVKEKGRDSIWKFILQNTYKPYFLSNKFDYIIGNPPWFTYSSIKNEEYQRQLESIAVKYDVKPVSAKNFPHLEIAAIFLSYCSSYFLKDRGKLAFVLPRSFWSADHHDNTRSGKAKGFHLIDIWDLHDISPLFRIPSGVLFTEKVGYGFPKKMKAAGLAGKTFSGTLPAHNCNLKIAKTKITEAPVTWFYIKQGKSSAFSTRKVKAQTKENPYKKEFKQGATLVPRTFYFVELDMDLEKGWEKDFDWKDRTLNLKTSQAVLPDAKMPWKQMEFKGIMPSEFVFRTALSKSILPFALYKPDLVVLPIEIKQTKQKTKTIKLLEQKDIFDLDARKWFRNAQNLWSLNSTEKSSKMTANDRIDFQKGISEQNLNAPYLVLYNSSAKDANATVVSRKNLDLEFIVDHKTYVFYTSDGGEAYYLAAILNSTTPNAMMKDFQSRGLFGARDVHKKILDIYYPKYDEKDITHTRLAELSQAAHQKASEYLQSNLPKQELSGIHLGKIRLEIKKHLAVEMKEIDKLVKKVIG